MFQATNSSSSISSSDIQQKTVLSSYKLSAVSLAVWVITGGEKSWSIGGVYQEVVMFGGIVMIFPGTQSDIREDVSVGLLMLDGAGRAKSPPPGGLMLIMRGLAVIERRGEGKHQEDIRHTKGPPNH
jgi:hypothetical protein